MANRETLKQAGYTLAASLGDGEYILRESDTGKLELWFANKGHASYGIKYRGTDLEFARSISAEEAHRLVNWSEGNKETKARVKRNPASKYSSSQLDRFALRDLMSDAKIAEGQAKTGPYYPEKGITKASLLAYAKSCRDKAKKHSRGGAHDAVLGAAR
ncbi:MAG TPA: hypothetical protein DHV25_04650 [Candidatus Kerfeldbacteria bacterium]|nr:hypothetical protein [Candidatus Kerfeldbacteria bacterium]